MGVESVKGAKGGGRRRGEGEGGREEGRGAHLSSGTAGLGSRTCGGTKQDMISHITRILTVHYQKTNCNT